MENFWNNVTITITIPEEKYQCGFRLCEDPVLLGNKGIILQEKVLKFKPGYVYSSFSLERAKKEKGSKVAENITLVTRYRNEVDDEDQPCKTPMNERDYYFRIKATKPGGFTLYDLARAMHLIERYQDLDNKKDGNIMVYAIVLDNKGNMKYKASS